MGSHPDLRAEQAHIDRAYQRIDSLRAAAREVLESALRERGGTPQALAERDVLVRTALHRLDQLELGHQALCFGRIDRQDGESYHIGRLALSGEDQEPLVVDWRAPVAEPFYRATGRDPMGLVLRRHFLTEGRRVLGIEDELFGSGGARPSANGPTDRRADGPRDRTGGRPVGLSGPSALLAALERSRSGRMGDIVATVQAEQDEVIRAELPGVLAVQGGPGTGKTAVALHRAAYLLYTYRFPLERQGVLVVGPNPLFLRYIEQVLPALGESGVALSTLQGLFPSARVKAEDRHLAAAVKGDARMARVLARAVRDRQRPLRRTLEVGFEGFWLRLDVEASTEVVARARRRGGTHNARRRLVEALVARHLWHDYQRALDRRDRWTSLQGPGHGQPPTLPSSSEELWRSLRRRPEVATALDRMWPRLSPEELVHDLLGAPPLLRLAADGLLTEREQAALHRPRSSSLEAIPWALGDLALLDEARVLLGPRRPTGTEKDDIRTYGHIVVDEVQDLTPMQLRMLSRRSLSGSMTVVGDVAQATGPLAPSGWDEITAHLPSRVPPRLVALSVNYRTPEEIMALAGGLVRTTEPELQPPQSVRATGTRPLLLAVEGQHLPSRVAHTAKSEMQRVAPGTVAVIAPPSMVAVVGRGLEAAGVDFATADHHGLDSPVTVLPVDLVKGLEFDSVIVVEPARLVAEAAQGLQALYVALTRTTQRLTLVHGEPLPEALRSDGPAH